MRNDLILNIEPRFPPPLSRVVNILASTANLEQRNVKAHSHTRRERGNKKKGNGVLMMLTDSLLPQRRQSSVAEE